MEHELREMRQQLAAAITRIDRLLADLAEDDEQQRRIDFDAARR